MSSLKVLGWAVPALGLSAAAWMGWQRREAGPPPAGPEVKIVTVLKGPIRQVVREIGHLQPLVSAEVKPEISGRVTQVLASVGQAVQVGEVLVRLDDRILLKGLEEARIDVEQASLNEEKARRNLDRRLQLERGGQGLISPEELEDSRTEYALAIVARRQAETAVQKVEEELQHTAVTAPLAGTVLACAVKPGDVVVGSTSAASPTPLMLLADTARMSVVVAVNEMDYPKVAAGQRVEVRAVALGADVFPGEITAVGLAGNADAKNKNIITFTVEAVVKDPRGKLRSGMTATVDIITREKQQALLLPREAVLMREGRCRLIRVSGGKEETLDLDTGLETETEVEIASGLEAGDEVKQGAWTQEDLEAFRKDVDERRKKRAGHTRF